MKGIEENRAEAGRQANEAIHSLLVRKGPPVVVALDGGSGQGRVKVYIRRLTMTMRTALVLLVVLTLSGCLNDLGVAPADRLGELGNTEYAVLAAIVKSVIVRPADSVVVLQDSTDPGVSENDREGALTRVLSFVSRQIPSLTSETVQNFKTKNLTSTYIRDPQRIHAGCVHSSRVTRTLPWLEVSRVGFSADGQQALAYVGYTYGLDAGEGIYYVLSRQDGTWKVIGRFGIWVS